MLLLPSSCLPASYGSYLLHLWYTATIEEVGRVAAAALLSAISPQRYSGYGIIIDDVSSPCVPHHAVIL